MTTLVRASCRLSTTDTLVFAATRSSPRVFAATGRSLLATANRYVCSGWCAPNQCIRVGTTGLTKCNRCKNNMKPILSGVNMGQCGEQQQPPRRHICPGMQDSSSSATVCPDKQQRHSSLSNT